jgi:hypothetical protein
MPASFPRANHDPRVIFYSAAILLLATVPLWSQVQANPNPGTKPPPATSTTEESAALGPLVQLNNALEALASKVSPAVVQILVTGYGPLHEESRTQTALIVRQHAVGSGVIVDSDGYIMTNAHVVEGAQRIRVALPLPGESGRPVPVGKRHILGARLVGVHKETDLALLKIEEKDLPTLPLLSQQRARVGQLVFAIGSPEGLQNSVTMGVVSAVARQPDPDKPLTYIQTDAPINPGNSGFYSFRRRRQRRPRLRHSRPRRRFRLSQPAQVRPRTPRRDWGRRPGDHPHAGRWSPPLATLGCHRRRRQARRACRRRRPAGSGYCSNRGRSPRRNSSGPYFSTLSSPPR